MNLSIELIKIIIFLIPGIISILLIEKFTVNKKISFERFAIYSIVLSFVIYMFHYILWIIIYKIYQYFQWNAPVIATPKVILYIFLKNHNLENITNPFMFLWIIFIAVISSMFISYAINNKYINRLGLFLHITTKYGDESVWDYFHNIQNVDWVVVRDLKNDLMYFGWINIFSDNDSKYDELLMTDVTVYQNSTGEELYEVDKIYIAGIRENFRIEIYNYEEKNNVKK